MAPSGFVNQTQLSDEVNKAIRKLGNDVVHVHCNMGSNTSGDPAIFSVSCYQIRPAAR